MKPLCVHVTVFDVSWKLWFHFALSSVILSILSDLETQSISWAAYSTSYVYLFVIFGEKADSLSPWSNAEPSRRSSSSTPTTKKYWDGTADVTFNLGKINTLRSSLAPPHSILFRIGCNEKTLLKLPLLREKHEAGLSCQKRNKQQRYVIWHGDK